MLARYMIIVINEIKAAQLNASDYKILTENI